MRRGVNKYFKEHLYFFTYLLLVCVCAVKKQVAQQQKKLRQECLRLQSQLAEARAKFQKETEVRDHETFDVCLCVCFLCIVKSSCVCVGEAAVTRASMAKQDRAAAADRVLLCVGLCGLRSAVEQLSQGEHGHTVAG